MSGWRICEEKGNNFCMLSCRKRRRQLKILFSSGGSYLFVTGDNLVDPPVYSYNCLWNKRVETFLENVYFDS